VLAGQEQPVLVTGATGNVGREVVRALVEQGRAVRAAVRRTKDGEALRSEGVETVVLDFQDPDTFAPAAEGVGAIFLLRPPAIAKVKPTLNAFLDVVAATGPRHVVFLSVQGADRNPLVPHHAVEQHLLGGGLPWTFLRPGFFAQNLADAYRIDIRDDDRLFVPAEEGRVAFVDARDIADVAARCLGHAHHQGRAYTLTGAEALTFAEVAELLTAALGRRITYERAGRQEYFAHLRRRHGLAWAQSAVQTILHVGLAFGDAATIDPTLGTLLGRPPRTMRGFIADHVALWRRPSDRRAE
jgi:uncharacterized protein YbjT (DUF2867 family)